MMTQHLFHDRAKVGIAMARVTPSSALAGAIILGLTRRRYAELIATADIALDEPEAAITPTSRDTILGTES
jgi:hypothetical protein